MYHNKCGEVVKRGNISKEVCIIDLHASQTHSIASLSNVTIRTKGWSRETSGPLGSRKEC